MLNKQIHLFSLNVIHPSYCKDFNIMEMEIDSDFSGTPEVPKKYCFNNLLKERLMKMFVRYN